MTSFRFRSALASLLLAVSGSVAALLSSPSLALERLRMTLPLLETAVTLELGQAQTAQQLLKANPDLAELDQVGEGAVTRVLEQMLTASLPKQSVGFVRESAGDPLFEQALLAASELVEVEGLSAPLTGADLRIALKAASKDGQPHLLGVLRRLPGTTASIDLQALVFYANRLARHQRGVQTLIDGGQAERAMSQTARGTQDQQPGWRRRQASLPVPHRPRPLELVIV